MQDSRKTSVVITCHNYGKFLKEAIDSALNQSVKPKEVIVVNDASADDSEKIAKSYRDKIKYFQVEFKNAQKARNLGLQKSSGEFVVFLDADDYFDNNFLKYTQVELEGDKELDLVYTDRSHIGEKKFLEDLGFKSCWKTEEFDYDKLTQYNYISLPSLIRKKKFKGFDEEIKRFQDWDAWLTLLKNGEAKRIAESLFTVRFHGENKTFTVDSILERIKVLAKHKLYDILANDYRKVVLELGDLRKTIQQKDQEIQQKDQELQQKDQEIQQERNVIAVRESIIRQKNAEIKMMKSSRFWKMREVYYRINSKIARKKKHG